MMGKYAIQPGSAYSLDELCESIRLGDVVTAMKPSGLILASNLQIGRASKNPTLQIISHSARYSVSHSELQICRLAGFLAFQGWLYLWVLGAFFKRHYVLFTAISWWAFPEKSFVIVDYHWLPNKTILLILLYSIISFLNGRTTHLRIYPGDVLIYLIVPLKQGA